MIALLSALVIGKDANGNAAAIGGGIAALIGVLIGFVRVPSGALPDRIARARAIQAWQTMDGRVTVNAEPSRGVRDLRGLGFAAIGGALIARWPLWTMFLPWRAAGRRPCPWIRHPPSTWPACGYPSAAGCAGW